MATVYTVEVCSHWVNYSKEDIQRMLDKAAKDIDYKCSTNEISFDVHDISEVEKLKEENADLRCELVEKEVALNKAYISGIIIVLSYVAAVIALTS
jgi:hypothetical protein